MSTRLRWIRWLGIWLTLIIGLGYLLGKLVGPVAPPHLAWSGAFILGSAITFLLVPSPTDIE